MGEYGSGQHAAECIESGGNGDRVSAGKEVTCQDGTESGILHPHFEGEGTAHRWVESNSPSRCVSCGIAA